MSEIRATTISDLAGTGPATLTKQYAAKAWVNFNGQGTVAIRASGNVSSITDVGTGEYRVNYTAALSDADYVVLVTAGGDNIVGTAQRGAPHSSTNVGLYFVNLAGSGTDVLRANIVVTR